MVIAGIKGASPFLPRFQLSGHWSSGTWADVPGYFTSRFGAEKIRQNK
jgi:hypothetical protein